jgi:hypothetical protein
VNSIDDHDEHSDKTKASSTSRLFANFRAMTPPRQVPSKSTRRPSSPRFSEHHESAATEEQHTDTPLAPSNDSIDVSVPLHENVVAVEPDGRIVSRASTTPSSTSMMALHAGDLIYLQKDDIEGVVFGDMNLRHLGLETNWRKVSSGKAPFGSWRFQNCIFRVCPKLTYRSKVELMSLEREQGTINATKDNEGKEIKLARDRADIEKKQNLRLLEHLQQGRSNKIIKYGDVIQLEHVSSGLFVTAHESAAPVNPHCRRVSLEAEGSNAAHFRILPRWVALIHSTTLSQIKGVPLFFEGTKFALLAHPLFLKIVSNFSQLCSKLSLLVRTQLRQPNTYVPRPLLSELKRDCFHMAPRLR